MMNRLPTVLFIALLFIYQSVVYTQAITTEITATNFDTVSVVSYNLLNYPADNSTRDPFMRRVVHTVKPDILVVQEMTSSSGVTTFLNNVLNYYQAGLYTTIAFHDGPDTDSHIYLKSGKATVISAAYIPTALRDIAEYVVRFTSSSDTIRFYSLHLKASTGYETDRLAEATILRNYLNNLPSGTKFMVMGDYNIYTSTEPAFQKLIGSEADNDGRCKDPINAVGDWNNNSTFKAIHTQSPRVRQFGGGSTGGMDDRFDIILTSYSSLDANTIVSSYKAYGNDGNHFNDSINRLPNTAVPDSVANGLHYGSDHLPVTCNFKFEKSVSAFQLVSPLTGSVNQQISGTLRWRASSNATGYDVYFDQNNPPTTIVSSNQTDTTFTYSNLNINNLYYWKVVAKNGTKFITSTSAPWYFTTLSIDPPGSFELISPANNSDNQNLSGLLSWQSSTNVTGYDIYLDTINPPVLRVDSNGTDTMYSYKNLHGGITYYWKIVSKNSAGSTTALNVPWSFATAIPPTAPTNLYSTIITSTSINLAWIDNAGDEDGYHIYRSDNIAGPFNLVGGDLIVNSTSYTDTGLDVNHKYYYRVVAFNNIGESDIASIEKSTYALIPEISELNEITPHSFRLKINVFANPSATEYLVRVIKATDTSFVQNNGLLTSLKFWNTFQILGDTIGIIVSDLDSCSTYLVDVSARNLDGIETEFSSVVVQSLPCYLFSGSVNAGWNLVSLPITVNDAAKQTLFPSSISNAFSYSGSYVATDSLKLGFGYWLKFGSSSMVEISGDPVYSDTIDLIEGWNLIGSITQPVILSSLITIPSGIELSSFFQYQGSYILSSTLEPLKAYWVKASSPCQLVINQNLLNMTLPIKLDYENKLPDQNVFTFTDRAGYTQSLYLSSSRQNHNISFDLPPVPPEGAFDVRFKSNQSSEILHGDISTDEFPILVQSSAFPVKMQWKIEDQKNYYSFTNEHEKLNLEKYGELNIAGPGSYGITVQSTGSMQKPRQYRLNQNYPNPFNPVTFISYELPEKSIVKLMVFNNLGNEIAILDEGVRESGSHRIRWEPNCAGGVYYYRLLATAVDDNSQSFQSVLRMTLLK
jgi:endonuclease/exonuclease/phosphatase family metal-dependent hydrolase